MTTVAVLADPPREGLVLPRLPETSPLTPAEAADLYEAMLSDVLAAVERSGGDLLVNYRPDELLPETHRSDRSAEADVRAVVDRALPDVEEGPRLEVQVGSTLAARVGNTITHLLGREEVRSAAVVRPNAPLLERQHVDSAAMKLRRSEVVLGPAAGGRTYYAGFAEPVDFTNAYDPPELETLTDRGLAAELDIDFAPVLPLVETGSDLATLVSLVRAKVGAGRIVPERTALWIDERGLRTVEENGEPAVARA